MSLQNGVEEEEEAAAAATTDTPSSSSSVLCFDHCGHRVYSLAELPASCPVCSVPVAECEFDLPPFKLPDPFTRAWECPMSLVIRPTKCDFLSADYRSGDDLHVGVTDSRGVVHEYDKDGIKKVDGKDMGKSNSSMWSRCIAVKLLEDPAVDQDIVRDPDFGEYWDLCLDRTCAGGDYWSGGRYDARSNNCFDFVLTFLRSLRTSHVSAVARDRVGFCGRYLLPRTRLAARYIALHRRLAEVEAGVLAVRKKRGEDDEEEDRGGEPGEASAASETD